MTLFFVHIPKTAGTSFRLAASDYFGASAVTYDYGANQRETAPSVRDCVYGDTPDWWRLKRTLEASGQSLLGGHVPVDKYVSLLGVANTLTFLRDPLQRIVSDYEHFRRHHGYTGCFDTFYRHPTMQNRMQKMLQGVPIEAIGCIGMTEAYEESLGMLNTQYGISIGVKTENQGKTSLDDEHRLSDADREALTRLNQKDIALYRRCKALFETRQALMAKGQRYAHAAVIEASPRRISGWAWWSGDDPDPVTVEILVNGERVDEVTACDLRPNLCRFRPPRGGYVGFRRYGHFKPGDQVQCRVASTGQCFPPSPRPVKEAQ